MLEGFDLAVLLSVFKIVTNTDKESSMLASGDDVIVVVEELPFDRPQALGAVIRKPGPRGHVWVRSRRSRKYKLPYARSADRRNMCRVRTEVDERRRY